MDRQVQTYQTQQIMTSDPVTLVSLLYDKAVLCLKTAVLAIHKNEIEERWRNNSKAAEIIGHLLMTLDLEKGGEIAANLEALYRYMLRRLVQVDAQNEARAAEEVIELLEPLRASWKELAKSHGEFKMDPATMDAAAAAAQEPADREAQPQAWTASADVGSDDALAPRLAATRQLA